MARTAEWKLVYTPGRERQELYDLRADPLETRNLVDDPVQTGVRERLKGDLTAWLGRTGDPWPAVPVPARLVPDPSDLRSAPTGEGSRPSEVGS